ncbi:MAG: hypothetical protein ACRDGJ_00595 [Candidatus Limnocylindria bacterium]
MTLAALFARLVELMREAEIPFMVVGSLASSFHGEPRSTMDVDIVIAPTPEALRRMIAMVEASDMYVSPEAAMEALERRTQFNAIDPATGLKADFVIRPDRAFSREEFRRRQAADVSGTTAFVATAEDTLIAKLEWAKAGDSERQLRDVAGILAISGAELDRAYIERWVDELGLQDLWTAVSTPSLDTP